MAPPLLLSNRESYTVTAELLRNNAPEAACTGSAEGLHGSRDICTNKRTPPV